METKTIGFAGTMAAENGNKWAFIQIFGQQFSRIMDATYDEDEFIARIKRDLAVDWLKESGNE